MEAEVEEGTEEATVVVAIAQHRRQLTASQCLQRTQLSAGTQQASQPCQVDPPQESLLQVQVNGSGHCSHWPLWQWVRVQVQRQERTRGPDL